MENRNRIFFRIGGSALLLLVVTAISIWLSGTWFPILTVYFAGMFALSWISGAARRLPASVDAAMAEVEGLFLTEQREK